MKKLFFLIFLLITVNNLFAQLIPNVKNSWVGNSFGTPDKHIPHNTDNIYVTPSGKVAIITGWEEGGHNVVVFDNNGTQISVPEQSGTGSWGRMSGNQVFLDDTYIYQVFSQHGCDGGNGDGINYPVCGTKWQCIRRYKMDGTGAPFPSGKGYDRSFLVVTTDEKGLNGVLVYNNELYVGDIGAGIIKVYNATTMSDIPVRSFSVGSGGVMDYDSQGNLWTLDVEKQKIVRFSTTGVVLSQQINFPANVVATAFCVDKINNRILVSNNGVDQNILIYTNIFDKPTQTGTFGITGGINSGTQGEMAPLKFSEPKGVGIDATGNIYVANNGVRQGGVRLEKYNTSNVLQWQKNGMIFTANGGMDNETETDFYTHEFHFKMNLQNTAFGSEWSLKGTTINRFAYPEDDRLNEAFWTTSYLRNVLGKKMLFTSDMYGRDLAVSKFTPTSAEIALPSVLFSTKEYDEFVWTDINNDQKHQSNEYDKVKIDNFYGTHIVPDKAGNVWKTNRESGIRYFPVKGIDTHGNPIYSYATSTLFANPTGIADVKRIEYDVNTGDLFVTGRSLSSITDEWGAAGDVLNKYTNYLSNPNASPIWSVTLPFHQVKINNVFQPLSDDNIKAFCVEGDYIFTIAKVNGIITVRNRTDGNIVGTIKPGESTNFKTGWADINGAISAHKRPNGEYLIFAEENGYGKIMMYRWCPSNNCVETDNKLTTNTNYINFKAKSYTQTISIESNIDWSISGAPSWVILNKENANGNQTIEVLSYANETLANRTATLTVSGGGLTKKITLFQQQLDTIAPNAVSGIAVSLITPFSFSLSWVASTDNVLVTKYEIFKNGIPFTTVTGTSLNIVGLIPSTVYDITVRAIDASGNISESSTKNVTTLELAFPYITSRGDTPDWSEYDEKAFDGDNYSKWSDGNSESWIQIQYALPIVYNQYTIVSGNDSPKRDPKSWILEASNDGVLWKTLNSRKKEFWTGRNQPRTFYFANTTPYTYYRLNITENNGENRTQLSEIIYANGTIIDTIAPSAPTKISPSFITQNTVKLDWNASSDEVGVTGYEVFKNGESIATISVGTSYMVTGLVSNTSNVFTVRAFDGSNNLSNQSLPIIIQNSEENPEIFITGRNTEIVSGTSTTSLTGGTNFANVNLGTSFVRTFVINNTGLAILTIGTISFTNSNFTVANSQSATILPGQSTSLNIRYTPTSLGTDVCIVSIVNNDANENPYTFAIKGQGVSPEILVKGRAAIEIASGTTTATIVGGTNFNTVNLGSNFTRSYNIANTGSARLNISSITLSNPSYSLENTLTFIGEGGNADFRVKYSPTVSGKSDCTVSIASNDVDENPFTFAITGQGVTPEIVVKGRAAIEIASGTTSTSIVGGTNFNTVNLGSSFTRSYNIANIGSARLNISSIILSNPSYTLLNNLAFIGVGGNADFRVKYSPTVSGTSNCTVTIASNDADENPFTFALTGTGVTSGGINFVNKGELLDETQEKTNEVEIYPNPANASFEVLIPSESATITVISLDGRVVKQVNVNSKITTINSGNWVAGTYLIKVESNLGIDIKKIIINN